MAPTRRRVLSVTLEATRDGAHADAAVRALRAE